MKKMKWLGMLLVAMMTITMAACGGEENDEPDVPAGPDYSAELPGLWNVWGYTNTTSGDKVNYDGKKGYPEMTVTYNEENENYRFSFKMPSGATTTKTYTLDGDKILLNNKQVATIEKCGSTGTIQMVILWQQDAGDPFTTAAKAPCRVDYGWKR